jgi:phosphoglycolate phosphatase
MANVKLVIFDVAGTTAKDDGLVVKAFQIAMREAGIAADSDQMLKGTEYVKSTMGQRKIDVFTNIFNGDLVKANLAHEKFDSAYISLVNEGQLEEFQGISDFFKSLNENGIGIAITTGFPRTILQVIMNKLNWSEIVNISVSSDEVENGRPAPDMILKSIKLYNEKFFTSIKPEEIAVVGDTDSDMKSGIAAGAKFVVGVTSGAMTEETLKNSGATHILPFSTDLLTIIY